MMEVGYVAIAVDASKTGVKDINVLEQAVGQLAPDSPVRALLVNLRDSLTSGKGATLVEQDAELSPNKAAELIGVSRPFLLGFMKSGALSFTTVGTHQRIALTDLLEFNERRLAAGKLVAEAAGNAATRERAAVEARAPISDEALSELDEL
jgi:excisionase family DNA binding protein